MNNRIFKQPARFRAGFAFSFLAAAVLPFAAHSAWTAKNPADGAVTNYALDPNTPATLYATTVDTAGTGGGVWKSTNSGDDFGGAAVNGTAEFNGVAVQPGNSNVIVAGVQGAGGISRSVNSGSNWNLEGTGNSDAWVFAFSPVNTSVVYAGGSIDGVGDDGLMLKSTDSGDNWVPLTNIAGDASPDVLSVAADPDDANTVFVGAKVDTGGADGLYRSTDGGNNWTKLNGPGSPAFSSVETLAIDPNNGNIIYAGTSFADEIWRSTDGGSTWEEIFDGSTDGFLGFLVRGIAVDPDDSRVIYAAGGATFKVIASSDCGATWTDVTSTGIVGSPGKVRIDTQNDFVYVLENLLNGVIYRETLGNGLAAASGSCPAGSPPGGDDDDGNFITGDGDGGSSGSSIGYPLLGVFILLGFFRIWKIKKTMK